MAAEPRSDFDEMSDAEVVAAAKQARRDADLAPAPYLRELGQACASLNRRGWTWDRIGREMGVNLSTAFRWGKPYLDDTPE